jgi:hypothetical protein
LCNLASCDCYVDESKVFHFFEENSNECVEDAVVDGANLLENRGLGPDVLAVKNRIWVYGEDENGLPIVAVAEESSSQTSYNVKEKIIKDTKISTMTEAEDRADAELMLLKSTETTGKVKSLALMKIEPADLLWISIPINNIHDQYKVIDIKYRIDGTGLFTTECEVAKLGFELPRFFKERMQHEMSSEYIPNPNKLWYSFNEEFNASSGTFTDTKLSDGKLMLNTGETTGTWVSDIKTASSNITQVEFRAIGQDLESSTFEISADNGLNWKEVERNKLTTLTYTGTSLKMRLTLLKDLDNLFPQVDSCVCLFK